MSIAAHVGRTSETERSLAQNYHRVRFGHDERRAKAWRPISAYLQRWVDANKPLLDLGSGYGEFARFIKASKKSAIDLNDQLIAYWAPEVQPLIQSALSPWPVEDESQGTVFASNFFEHFAIEDSETIVLQARRKLAPGGRLVVVQPNFRLAPGRYFDDYTHKQIFTDQSFADFLASSGFSVVHRENRFTPLTLQAHVPVQEWLVRLYLASPFRPLAGQFLIVAEKG